ncbi:MAG: hypothetical protein HQK75_00085 [Candidatus Magnetomorum sp.]|nr:hypothetical protein [Candidatus Magnetomorum sp.]
MNRLIKIFSIIGIWVCIFLIPGIAVSRIKLVALPERGSVVIRLDHPDGAFIEEERTLGLEKGVNKVDFSWKDVRIDPDSIQLIILTHPKQIQLLNVSFPSDENALVWEINSSSGGDEQVRVCYLLEGIDQLIHYQLVVNEKETQARLKMAVIVRNFSGEKFSFANVWLGYGQMVPLSIDHKETRKIVLKDSNTISIEKRWEWNDEKEPWQNPFPQQSKGIPILYELINSTTNGLGEHVLTQGKVRVFQEGKGGQTIFLGEDQIEAVPVGEKMKICIGKSFDISVDQRVMETRKINIRNNLKNRIVLYDTEELITAKLQNFKTTPVKLSMIQHIQGQWEMIESNIPFLLKNASELVFDISFAPLEKKELSFRFNRRNIRP